MNATQWCGGLYKWAGAVLLAREYQREGAPQWVACCAVRSARLQNGMVGLGRGVCGH